MSETQAYQHKQKRTSFKHPKEIYIKLKNPENDTARLVLSKIIFRKSSVIIEKNTKLQRNQQKKCSTETHIKCI